MILITGANGQLGQCLKAIATRQPDLPLLFTDSAALDITDARAVRRFFLEIPGIRWCVNCAAYTAVDKAESEPETAKRVNTLGPANLARLCAETGAGLIHISSDYVYHNRVNRPLVETDPLSPKSVYARTKLGGDRAVLRLNPQSIVLRTSWVYSEYGHNFVKTMLRLGRERSELRVVYDQIGTPTYAPELAAAILEIIQKVEAGTVSRPDAAGIFHYANEGVTSWYDFAQAIFAHAGISCTVHPIESKDYPTPAARPPFSVLNKGKIKAVFGLEIPHWQKSLEGCLKLLS